MVAASESSQVAWKVPPVVVVLLAGASWWLIGYLPWVLTGLNGSDLTFSEPRMHAPASSASNEGRSLIIS